MQKIIFTLFSFFSLNILFGQSDIMLEIENINSEFEKRDLRNTLDTVSDGIVKVWDRLSEVNKKLVIKSFNNKKNDIKSETSKVTRVYLTGKENNIIIQLNNKELKFNNLKRHFKRLDYENETMDSIYDRIQVAKLERHSGINQIKIIYPDLNRFAVLKLDTSYSSILIWASAIKSKAEIEEEEIDDDKNTINKNLDIKSIEIIEVLIDEEITVYHEIPEKNSVGNKM